MLEHYSLVYYITILPNIVIYSASTPANQPYHFSDPLEVPPNYSHYPIECIFLLFDSTGKLVLSSHQQAYYNSLKAIINTIPLKMLKELAQLVS